MELRPRSTMAVVAKALLVLLLWPQEPLKASARSNSRFYTGEDLEKLKKQAHEMFHRAYQGYLDHAYPLDELKPLTCDGTDTWGSYSLTLVDALDTLIVMGNTTEFARVYHHLVAQRTNFDVDINVSVFESNIRVVGGLLSAHLLSYRSPEIQLDTGWPCRGPLLRLAEDLASRLLPAFDTATGMPYGTVNLRSGVPPDETSVTCVAGVGTFVVEFGTLSRLTGNPVFEEAALRALRSLWQTRSKLGLFGNHLDVQTGRWVATEASIGAGVDSYFEYLVKGAGLLQRPELMKMFQEARGPIERYLNHDSWYFMAAMKEGMVTTPAFQSLEAFWPGLLSLAGDQRAAVKTMHNYYLVQKRYGFLPELYNVAFAGTGLKREGYPLRPELVESALHLYKATKDPFFVQVGEDVLKAIEHSAGTDCGYATVKDVRDHTLEDRMESFFLAETTKYLYLLFDPDNFLNSPGAAAHVVDTTLHGRCVVGAGGYVFNSEAHPMDPAALLCCHNHTQDDLQAFLAENMADLLLDPDSSEFQGKPLSSRWVKSDDVQTSRPHSILTPEEESGSSESASDKPGPVTDQVSIHHPGDSEQEASSDLQQMMKPPRKLPSFVQNASKMAKKLQALLAKYLNSTNTVFAFDQVEFHQRMVAGGPQFALNSSWYNEYGLLSCPAKTFADRFSIQGEIFPL